jgi:lysophospholipase L1-like esterase
MDRMKLFVQSRSTLGRLASALLVLVIAGCMVEAQKPGPKVAAEVPLGTLPGAQIWNHGASSLLFGTNDTYEWSNNNLESQPAIQVALKSAGFTLVRTFIPDNATDATIDTRIATIENIGASCLAVLTNIQDITFNEHVVSYLGKRCLLYEFGNESDYWGTSVSDYLAAWNSTIPLLRHINPSARFIGPVTYNDQGISNFMEQFLYGVKASGILPDAISFHYYPCYNDTASSCLAKADTYETVTLGVRQMVKQILGKELPVGITEWNYDPGTPSATYGNDASFITKFTTTAIQSMIAGGVAFACQFDAASYAAYGQLDLFNVDNNQAKPQYYALASMIKQYKPASAASASPAATTKPASTSLISQGATTICSSNDSGPNEPAALTDGKFANWGFWQLATNTLPGWCALHFSLRASNVLLAWFSDYSFDYTDPTSLAPQDYTISVSADSTNGSDGTWRTVVTVLGNHARAREHMIGFTGMSWIKMTVLAAQPNPSQPYIRIDELEVFDAQLLGTDTFFFSGDSITALAYYRDSGTLPSFADNLASCAPHFYPLTVDGGFGGWSSSGAEAGIASWLAMLPDMHYWLLGWGSNDALAQVSPEVFRANLQAVVTQILQHGDIPVLAHIPYSTYHNLAWLSDEIQQLNQVIDEITAANHLTPGPDFYTLFQAHPQYLGPDGLHPSSSGAIAMNAGWFNTLRSQLKIACT